MAIPEAGKVITEALRQLPPGLGELPAEMKQALRIALQRALSELDLVTREEFEAQQQVLYKTRMKLEALEKRVAALEGAVEPGEDVLD